MKSAITIRAFAFALAALPLPTAYTGGSRQACH